LSTSACELSLQAQRPKRSARGRPWAGGPAAGRRVTSITRPSHSRPRYEHSGGQPLLRASRDLRHAEQVRGREAGVRVQSVLALARLPQALQRALARSVRHPGLHSAVGHIQPYPARGERGRQARALAARNCPAGHAVSEGGTSPPLHRVGLGLRKCLRMGPAGGLPGLRAAPNVAQLRWEAQLPAF